MGEVNIGKEETPDQDNKPSGEEKGEEVAEGGAGGNTEEQTLEQSTSNPDPKSLK